MFLGNARVAAALSKLFGSDTSSDCVIEFVLESGVDRPVKRARLEEPGASSGALDRPLPGHTFVLRFASEWFRAKLDDWSERHDDHPTSSAGEGSTVASHRPVLHVPLGSSEEVPSARAAIQFAYTGQVHADSVREALEVWRQASYLQIEDCGAACIQWIHDRVTQPADVSGHALTPSVAMLYACHSIWPDLESEPNFAHTVKMAQMQLVAHFRSALKTLNAHTLRHHLLALPAVAMEALLKSDLFATDTEDSVLLLLATWMERSYRGTDASTRQRLCRLVRLAQLSPPYANAILPALAADFQGSSSLSSSPLMSNRNDGQHEAQATDGANAAADGAGGDCPAGWFPISCAEAAVFGSFTSARTVVERQQLRLVAGRLYDIGSPWYHGTARIPILPPELLGFAPGCCLSFGWHIDRAQLDSALDGLDPDEVVDMYGTYDNGFKAVVLRGLEWKVSVRYSQGETVAGLFLSCHVPEALQAEGSRLSFGEVVGVAQLWARLEIYGGGGGAGPPELHHVRDFSPSLDAFGLGMGTRGVPDALRLRWPAVAAAGTGAGAGGAGAGMGEGEGAGMGEGAGGVGGGRGGEGGVEERLSGWADYLHDGRIAGRLTVIPCGDVWAW